MIEKGRHTNVEREFRFCPFCLERNVCFFYRGRVPFQRSDISTFFYSGDKIQLCSISIILLNYKVMTIIAVSKFLISSLSTYYPNKVFGNIVDITLCLYDI